uniref:Uncharacterized protein n=1 Tax=Anguilla anguilla TaxID=7936 RepID=A0A0E9UE40_ANGAN
MQIKVRERERCER